MKKLLLIGSLFLCAIQASAATGKYFTLTIVSGSVESHPFSENTVRRCRVVDGASIEHQLDAEGTTTLKSEPLLTDVAKLNGWAQEVSGVERPYDLGNYADFDNYWVQFPGGKNVLLRAVLRSPNAPTQVLQDESEAAKHLVMYMLSVCK